MTAPGGRVTKRNAAAPLNPVGEPIEVPGGHKGVTVRPIKTIVPQHQHTPHPVLTHVEGIEVTVQVKQREYDGAKLYSPGISKPGTQFLKAQKPIPRARAEKLVQRMPIFRPPVAANGAVTGVLRRNAPRASVNSNAPANDRYNVLIKASHSSSPRVAMLDTSEEISLVTDFVDRLVDNRFGKQACATWSAQKQIQVWLTYREGHLTHIGLTRPLVSYIL